MISVALNMSRIAANRQGMSWNCQGISHCLESGHPVTIICVGIVYIVEELNILRQHSPCHT